MLSLIGKMPLCNRHIERTFSINGFVFPLCYRCTFCLIGAFVSYKLNYSLPIWFLLPMIIDGSLQYVFRIESKNWKRIVTGFIFGMAWNSLDKLI